MKEVREVIATAIQKADKSYFFENYDKQARAVLVALAKEGYVLVPLEPSEAMMAAGVDQVLSGSIKPEKHVMRVYAAMMAACDQGEKKRR